MDHVLERNASGIYMCDVCGWTWRHKPDGACPRVHRYDLRSVPAHLKTRSELLRLGLQPADVYEPDGCIWRAAVGTYVWLYNEELAVPSPLAKPWQLAALEKRRQHQRTCSACGQVQETRDDLIAIHTAHENGGDTIRLCRKCAAERESVRA